jgi:hypothetical protein
MARSRAAIMARRQRSKFTVDYTVCIFAACARSRVRPSISPARVDYNATDRTPMEKNLLTDEVHTEEDEKYVQWARRERTAVVEKKARREEKAKAAAAKAAAPPPWEGRAAEGGRVAEEALRWSARHCSPTSDRVRNRAFPARQVSGSHDVQ